MFQSRSLFTALICTSLALTGAIYGALTPQLVALQEKVGFSDALAGVLTGSYTAGMLPGVVGVLVIGRRISARRLYLAGLVLIGGATCVFGIVGSYELLVLARSTQGLGAGICFAGGTAWLTSCSNANERGALLGLAWGGLTLGGVMGPAIGAMSQYVGSALLYGLMGLLFLTIAGAACEFGRRSTDPGETLPKVDAAPGTGAKTVAVGRRRMLLGTVCVLIAPALALGGLNALLPLMFDEMNTTNLMVAGVFLCAAAAGGLSSPLIGRATDRRGSTVILSAGLTLGTVCGAAMAIVTANAIALGVFAILYLGIANQLSTVPAVSMAQSSVDDGAAASVGALVAGTFAVFETAGAFGAVPLRDLVGPATPFIALALITVGSGFAFRTLVGRQVADRIATNLS